MHSLLLQDFLTNKLDIGSVRKNQRWIIKLFQIFQVLERFISQDDLHGEIEIATMSFIVCFRTLLCRLNFSFRGTVFATCGSNEGAKISFRLVVLGPFFYWGGGQGGDDQRWSLRYQTFKWLEKGSVGIAGEGGG